MANEFVEKIREAVALLEPANNDHWTQGGKPGVEIVRELTGDPSVTRADIDAACPDAKRDAPQAASTENGEGNGTDATQEPQGGGAPASQATDETQQGNQNAPAENSTDDGKGNSSDDEAGKTSEQDVQQPEPGTGSEPELEDIDAESVFLRGVCLAIILGLPDVYLTVGVAPLVDEMANYLESLDEGIERQVAIECIRSIARNRPTEIPAGAYKARINQGMGIVTGESAYMAGNMPTPADEQKAAFDRMNGVVKATPAPDGPEMPSTDEQKEAAARLAQL